jgi:hypothetical protein
MIMAKSLSEDRKEIVMAYAFNDDKRKAEVYSKDETYSKDEVYSKANIKIAEKSINISGANGEGNATFSASDFGLSAIDPEKTMIISVMEKKTNTWATTGGWNPTASMSPYGNYPPSFPYAQILTNGTIRGYVCKSGASTASETIKIKIAILIY